MPFMLCVIMLNVIMLSVMAPLITFHFLCNLGMGPVLHNTRLESLPEDKQSSLLGSLVRYEKNEVL
jgi:hypothetical protein